MLPMMCVLPTRTLLQFIAQRSRRQMQSGGQRVPWEDGILRPRMANRSWLGWDSPSSFLLLHHPIHKLAFQHYQKCPRLDSKSLGHPMGQQWVPLDSTAIRLLGRIAPYLLPDCHSFGPYDKCPTQRAAVLGTEKPITLPLKASLYPS